MSAATVSTPVAAPPGARLLASTPARSVREHLTRFGELPSLAPAQLLSLVEAGRLTGRGGAGFPVARKLATAIAARGSVVVGNGAEGEPASRKDRTLLETCPQLVLDGLELLARATDADRAVLYVHEGPAAVAATRAVADRAVSARRALGIEVVAAPALFLAGEESALANRVGGGPALPRTPAVWASGVRGKPTLVQNVETLAHLALLARFGAAWFTGVGDPEAPGSMLFSVSVAGADANTIRIVEAPTGTPYAQVLAAAGVTTTPQALLVGGYHGAWLPPAAITGPSTRAALARYGASPGAGVTIALPSDMCPLDHAARVVRYLAAQTAGQCGPCVNGLPAIAASMARMVGGDPAAAAAVARYAGLVEGRGGCHHPDGTAKLVRSTLHTFADDVAAHARNRCTARTAP
jgi:NADH:ubiquinone oxidoreductase subunit F (NADH-binding)